MHARRLRKRLLHSASEDDQDDRERAGRLRNPSESVRKRRISSGGEQQKQQQRRQRRRSPLIRSDGGGGLMAERQRPQRSFDLCVHKQKLARIRRWLLENAAQRHSRQRVLLLKGPAGCGKSATLHVLCRELDLEPVFWNEEVDFSSHLYRQQERSGFGRNQEHLFPPYESKLKKLQHFFHRAQRYSGLSAQARQKLIIVEDLPFISRPDLRDQFREIFQRECLNSRYAVAFTFSIELESSPSAASRILGKELISDPRVEIIEMNPVSATAMRRALRRICTLEHIEMDNTSLEALVGISHGDLRSAIHNLEFWESNALQREQTLSLSSLPIPSSSPKLDKSSCGPLRSDDPSEEATSQRDHLLSLHHSLGKVLYAKDVPSIEEVVELSVLSDDVFCEYLHENSLRFLSSAAHSLSDFAAVLSAFSDSDVFSLSQHKHFSAISSYSSSVACRAYMITRTSASSHSNSWKPIYSPEGRHVAAEALKKRLSVAAVLSDKSVCTQFPSVVRFRGNRSLYSLVLPYLSVFQKRGYIHHLPSQLANVLWSIGCYSDPGKFFSRPSKDWSEDAFERSIASLQLESAPLPITVDERPVDPLREDDIESFSDE